MTETPTDWLDVSIIISRYDSKGRCVPDAVLLADYRPSDLWTASAQFVELLLREVHGDKPQSLANMDKITHAWGRPITLVKPSEPELPF